MDIMENQRNVPALDGQVGLSSGIRVTGEETGLPLLTGPAAVLC
jgi:hypothetical protein